MSGFNNPLDGINFNALNRIRELQEPIPRQAIKFPRGEDQASDYYERLVNWIQNFDANLGPDYEVGLRLVTFGQSVTFALQDMSYSDPYLISFIGTLEDGSPVELIQHVTQISILLMKVKRTNPEEPKKPIGFRMPERDGSAE